MFDETFIFNSLILVGLLIASAFFAAVEVAFVSLAPAKVRLLRDEKSRVAKIIVALKSRPQKFFVTISIWNNLVNIFAASFATAIALEIFGDAGLAIATGVMTFLILIFGEIFPKVFAQKHAESFARAMALPLFIFDWFVMPISWLMEKIFHLLGVKYIERMSVEEVVAAVDLGAESGEIKKSEQELIQNVLEFTDTRVDEVMTARVEMEALEKTTTVAEAEKFFQKNTHSRVPVFDGSVDKIVGILTLRQLFEHDGERDLPIEKLELFEPIFTPASRPIRALFQEFKSRRTHIAIVIDEHGGTLGLATLEDLLEEIFGEIEDEKDIPEVPIFEIDKKTLLIDGDVHLADIDEKLGTNLAVGEFASKNVAFLLLEKLGRLPQKNAKIRFENAELSIEAVDKNRIQKVKIEKI